MNAVLAPVEDRTLGDLLRRLGGISADRVRLKPPLGTATEQDLIEVETHEDRLCELIDGVLIEKAVGFRESYLAAALASIVHGFVVPRNAGIVVGAAAFVRLFPGTVRAPDLSFYSWDRLPHRRIPNVAIAPQGPDLAVEVLSPSNTPGEMARKRREYFNSGVRLVWEVDPEARTVAVYVAPEQVTVLNQDQTLEGRDVLPGFTLPLQVLFAELDRQGNG